MGNVAINGVTRRNNKVVYDSGNNENGNSIQTISIYLENHQLSSFDIEMIDVVDTIEFVCVWVGKRLQFPSHDAMSEILLNNNITLQLPIHGFSSP